MAKDKDYLLKNHVYDLLKKFTTLVLPAIGALYFGLAAIWGLPAAEQVVGTCAVLATFLGVIIKLGDNSYNASEDKFDGVVNIQAKPKGGELYAMELSKPAEDIKTQETLTFRVVDQTG